MSDVERLEAELALARLVETLEDKRGAMHGHRNAETVREYRAASEEVAAARKAFRERWRVEVSDGDAAPLVETVNGGAAVHTPGVA